MADVTFRFYGRFAFVNRGGEGIFALAPNFSTPFKPHDVRMSIRHDHLLFKPAPATTLKPSVRIASDIVIPDPRDPSKDPSPETLIWDLSGLSISIGMSQSTLQEDAEVLELAQLDDLVGSKATLKPSALTPSAAGESNAVIRMVNAAGKARAMDPGVFVHFARRADIGSPGNCRPDPGKVIKDPLSNPIKKKPADYADFKIPLGMASALEMTFSKGTTAAGLVTVRPGAMVCFSNLCAELKAPDHCDLEFAQYYNLVNSDTSPQLVPFEPEGPITGEGMGCYLLARIAK